MIFAYLYAVLSGTRLTLYEYFIIQWRGYATWQIEYIQLFSSIKNEPKRLYPIYLSAPVTGFICTASTFWKTKISYVRDIVRKDGRKNDDDYWRSAARELLLQLSTNRIREFLVLRSRLTLYNISVVQDVQLNQCGRLLEIRVVGLSERRGIATVHSQLELTQAKASRCRRNSAWVFISGCEVAPACVNGDWVCQSERTNLTP